MQTTRSTAAEPPGAAPAAVRAAPPAPPPGRSSPVRTALVVSHDSRLVAYADRVLHLEDGRLALDPHPVTLAALEVLS